MRTILITGPIGSGKSAVREILSSRGYPVYDCDSRCKALYEKVPGVKERIEEALGVPFSEIAVIFSDESKRLKLEAVVYPELMKDIFEWRDGLRGFDCCFIESAIALEKKEFDGVYDGVWLVDAPYEVRIARNPKVAERSHLQHFENIHPEKVIINDSTLENLDKQIEL